MPEILMSPDVRATLGPDAARRIAAVGSLSPGHCPVCRQDLPANGPAVVLVVRGTASVSAAYAHPACTPSTVIDVPEEVLAAQMPTELDMAMTTLLVEHGGVRLPVLVAEMPTAMAFHGTGQPAGLGELTNMLPATLLGQGFSLISRLRSAPRKAAGWVAAIGSDSEVGVVPLVVLAPDATVFYTGTAQLPAGWGPAARNLGWCVLYGSGTPVGWPETVDGRMGLRALRSVAASGDLVGARVAVVWRVP